MKTFQQFKEESDKFGVKKTMNNFMQNQNVQNLFTNQCNYEWNKICCDE